MKQTFILENDAWSLGDKPDQEYYPGFTYVLENNIWSVEEPVVWENGKVLNTLGFDSSTGAKLERVLTEPIDNNTPWTFSMWFKPDASHNAHWIQSWQDSSGLEFGLKINDSNDWQWPGNVDVWETTGRPISPESNLTDKLVNEVDADTWACFTLMYDPDNGKRLLLMRSQSLIYTTDSSPLQYAEYPHMGDKLLLGGGYNSSMPQGHIAHVLFIDGAMAGPSDYIDVDSNGKPIPKQYTGDFGPNGFNYTFQDPDFIGMDISGNDNHLTVEGIGSDQVEMEEVVSPYTVIELKKMIAKQKLKSKISRDL